MKSCDAGSCWAFSSSAALEMSYLQNVGGISPQNLRFSEEQVVACCNKARGFDSQGCDGGWPDEVNILFSTIHE